MNTTTDTTNDSPIINHSRNVVDSITLPTRRRRAALDFISRIANRVHLKYTAPAIVQLFGGCNCRRVVPK